MSIKQKLINNEITYHEACTDYYNDLTKENVDIIVEKYPWAAATYLNKHPFFTKKHVDIIVEREPWDAAKHLNQHPFLTQKHVDIIVEKYPWAAVEYLSHRLSEENIAYIANNRPELLKDVFR